MTSILADRDIGYTLIPSFVSNEMAQNLMNEIDQYAYQHGLSTAGNSSNFRRVQHFLHQYNYKSTAVTQKAPDPPFLSEGLARHLYEEGVFFQPIEQIIVNEYTRKQGIGKHTDSCTFGPVIASLSLGSEVLMKFENSSTGHSFELLLENGTLIYFWGPARYSYTHSISPNLTYYVKDVKRKRAENFRRVSITFRTLK